MVSEATTQDTPAVGGFVVALSRCNIEAEGRSGALPGNELDPTPGRVDARSIEDVRTRNAEVEGVPGAVAARSREEHELDQQAENNRTVPELE